LFALTRFSAALQRLLKEPSVTMGFKPNAAVMTSLFRFLYNFFNAVTSK
jgi:hypothetical protein